MSVVAVAVVLGLLLLRLVRTNQVNLGAALVAVVFGLVLAATPAGPVFDDALSQVGGWTWGQVSDL